jgi:hypothetical protein
MISRFIDFLIYGLIAFNGWLRRLFSDSVIKFKAVYGGPHVIYPVTTTKEIKPKWLEAQIEKAKLNKKSVKFVRCPGMHDYIQEGYIIRAHADIHIKANSMGVVATVPNASDQALMPAEMDVEVIEGCPPVDGVKLKVIKIPLPYALYMEPGHSAHLLPALMHSTFLDKLFVYPGTVDYDTFHTANFIFTPIRPCEFVIKAGEPLLHVLPFKRLNYHGVCGSSTAWEKIKHKHGFPSRVLGYYRRMFHAKKIYTSEVQK